VAFAQGGTIVHGRTAGWIAWALALLLTGCDEDPVSAPPPAGPLAEEGAQFDPATAGAIRGRVTWEGDLPSAPPYHAPVSPLSEQAGGTKRTWLNPNVPAVDSHTHGVAHAVVFLRGVDPRRARPWDHPPVRVRMRDYQVHVLQGDSDLRSGFVRRGDEVEFASAQPAFHSLQVRGAAFFALSFPDPSRPCRRRLGQAGLVELSSAAGYFWMRGHLFVDDHPYYTHTDAAGRFTLPRVPPGTYQLACWLPSWHEAARELDADTGLIARLTFRPPAEVVRPVTLAPGQTVTAPFVLSGKDFPR
jgi:hypothetical protein